jgi:hypothetical protein
LSLRNLNPIIGMNEMGYALDVQLVRLMTA